MCVYKFHIVNYLQPYPYVDTWVVVSVLIAHISSKGLSRIKGKHWRRRDIGCWNDLRFEGIIKII